MKCKDRTRQSKNQKNRNFNNRQQKHNQQTPMKLKIMLYSTAENMELPFKGYGMWHMAMTTGCL